jgi:DNA invertase Pin-like site-specific DNA recombinase
MSATPRLRCAVYTRKSSEEGLEQDFNSLHAQRDACEAFIHSQVGLGWKLIPDRYDDGGISGGTLVRPALQRLLQDVKSGRIDVVVVYKIDRLTRSLADFAKIVEVFDERSVSFVSVTQSFNTTSSMGRLTLNVLLSFAQFEREVTGERIRDKIAASKKKGIWMGGVVPLGYDVSARKLIINDAEAMTVRQLFALFLELGSIRLLQLRTQQLGLTTKRHTSRSGSHRGGFGFSRGHLRAILTNPIYVGRVKHGKHSYEGQHEAIVDRQTFDQVEALLASRANTSTSAAGKDGLHLLTGLIFDETGDRLSPTHATKSGTRYRYYVSRRVTKGAKADGPEPLRLPAVEIEKLIRNQLIQVLRSETQLLDMVTQSAVGAADIARLLSHAGALADALESSSFEQIKAIITALVERVAVNPDSIAIRLNAAGLLEIAGSKSITTHSDTDVASVIRTITVPIALRHRGVEIRLVLNNKPAAPSTPDPRLLSMLKQAHQLLQALTDGTALTIADLAAREQMDVSDLSRVIRFAFLAPDLAEAIMEGRQPVELTRRRLSRLPELPHLWSDQRAVLGF